MPELPDVEIFRRYLQSTVLHKKIRAVSVVEAAMLEGIDKPQFSKSLRGLSFTKTWRHGKYCFLGLDDQSLLFLHFGMTGFVKYYKNETTAPEHIRVAFEFTNDYTLAYDCQRKFGEIGITTDIKDFIASENLGPDALDDNFGEDDFIRRLQGRRGMLKPALMNQQIIAGIGNIYSDEILFQLRLHPKISLKELEKTTLQQVYRKMREILIKAIQADAEPEKMPASMLTTHRHGDGRCPSCKADIEKIEVAGRRACYCPSCQSGGTEERHDRQNC